MRAIENAMPFHYTVEDAITLNLEWLRRSAFPLPPTENAREYVRTFLTVPKTEGVPQTWGIQRHMLFDTPVSDADVFEEAA